jgi:hypothetical protein
VTDCIGDVEAGRAHAHFDSGTPRFYEGQSRRSEWRYRARRWVPSFSLGLVPAAAHIGTSSLAFQKGADDHREIRGAEFSGR